MRPSTDEELQKLFEEAWQLAEQVAASEDRHLAKYVFEIANEIAEWCNDIRKKQALEGL
jgi:hypothetical protein